MPSPAALKKVADAQLSLKKIDKAHMARVENLERQAAAIAAKQAQEESSYARRHKAALYQLEKVQAKLKV